MHIDEELDLFLTANLTFPRPTVCCLDFAMRPRLARCPGKGVAWAESDGRDDPVGIRPEVRVIEGEMDTRDLALLKQWIELNRDVLIRNWDGDIAFTEEVFAALRPIT